MHTSVLGFRRKEGVIKLHFIAVVLSDTFRDSARVETCLNKAFKGFRARMMFRGRSINDITNAALVSTRM